MANLIPPALDCVNLLLAHRLVRPYVIAAEQAARRRELLLADFGADGPGPYVIHGVEVA